MVSAEILAVLADEVAEAGEVIGRAAEALLETADESAFAEAREPYVEQVTRLTAVANTLGLVGLEQAGQFVRRNLEALRPGEEASPARRALFAQWPQLVLGYLRAPRDGVYSRELAEFFCRSDWPEPLDSAAAAEL